RHRSHPTYCHCSIIDAGESARDAKKRARLSRFFSSFSHIDYVIIDTFNDNKLLDLTMSTIGQLHITKLELRIHSCGKAIQKLILKLAKQHSVRYVSILAKRCSQDSLHTFFKQLARLGASVNIYEAICDNESFDNVLNYLHRPVEYWSAMKSQLEKDGVSLKLSTILDDKFVKIACAINVRTNLACKGMDRDEFHSDATKAGGYYRTK
ncbi:hypothetical protein PMAYCL1PPCAC_01057, partial [Pristionchus mayeri]